MSVRYKLDIEQPFIAIRHDREGTTMQKTLGEYVCNPLREDLVEVSVALGGFYSAEELGVLESIPKKFELGVVRSGGYAQYTMSTLDEFYEMAVNWTLSYRTATSEMQSVAFGTFKAFADAQKYSDLPLLGGAGFVIPRSFDYWSR